MISYPAVAGLPRYPPPGHAKRSAAGFEVATSCVPRLAGGGLFRRERKMGYYNRPSRQHSLVIAAASFSMMALLILLAILTNMMGW